MAVSIESKPADKCFISDGIVYELTRTPLSKTALQLTFAIGSDILNLLYFHVTTKIGRIYKDTFKVDLTDIVAAYASRYYYAEGSNIYGTTTVQLTHIDSVATNLDTLHTCLLGSSGGLDIDSALAETTHPFLTARGNEQGALHFYRSELRAMECIYALIPNVYEGGYIETNDRTYPDNALNAVIIDDSPLFCIKYKDTPYYHYDITQANTIYLHLTPDSEFHPAERTYQIAVQDDPDTDEMYLIRWVNSLGAIDAILITGELQDCSEIDSPEVYVTSQSLSGTQRAALRGEITTKYKLHTGYLTPARILALVDMLCSDKVEIQIDDEWIPVNVTADTKHAVHQREPETFELNIEVLEKTRYLKPNRTIVPIPAERASLLQDNSGDVITDNNSDTIY